MLHKDLIKNITDLRTNPLQIFRAAKKRGKPFFIFNRTEPVGVVLSWENYEWLQERLADLADITELREAKATSEELLDWKKVRQRLNS
jgi:prevent-host-death family protein